jgi:hypothetical protein
MCIAAVIFEYESEEQYLEANPQQPANWSQNYL